MTQVHTQRLDAFREASEMLDAMRQRLDDWRDDAVSGATEGLGQVLECLDALAAAVASIGDAKAEADRRRARLAAMAAGLGQRAPPPLPDPIGQVEAGLTDARQQALFRAVVSGRFARLLADAPAARRGRSRR